MLLLLLESIEFVVSTSSVLCRGAHLTDGTAHACLGLLLLSGSIFVLVAKLREVSLVSNVFGLLKLLRAILAESDAILLERV